MTVRGSRLDGAATKRRQRPLAPVDLTDALAKAGTPAFAQRLQTMLADQN